MSDDIQSQLNLAYEQVEAGQLEDAIATLEPILDANPDNADAWWIYTYASKDPAQARRALENVLRIDPDYPGAQDLFAQLNAEFPPAATEAAPRPVIRSIAPIAPPPPSVPEAPPSMPEPPRTPRALEPVMPTARPSDAMLETPRPTPAEPPVSAASTESTGSGNSTLTIVVFAVVVTAVIIALLLLNPGGEAPATEQPPTAVAADLTPTDAGAQVVITDEPTAEASPDESLTVTAESELATDIPVDVTEDTAQPDPTAVASEAATTAPTEEATEVAPTAEETSAAPTEEATEPVPTASATEVVASTPTEAASTAAETETPEAEATVSLDLTVPEALAGYTLADPPMTQESLSIGTTAVVNICSAPGAAARTLLREAMEAFAGTIETVDPQAEAIGVRLINCDSDALLVAVAAMRSDAEAFASGTLSAADFARTWAAVR